VSADELERHIVEQDKWFWEGCLIDKVFKETESLDSRYEEEDGELE